MKQVLILFIFLQVLLNSCNSKKETAPIDQKYVTEINDWQQKRIDNLKKENGWLNLVGLYWLEDGENSFGSSTKNKIVFPKKAHEKLGRFIKNDSTIIFESENNITVLSNGEKVTTIEMKADISGNPTILENGSLRWFIIKRGEKYGIRLRDLDAELVKNFEGIERFPLNLEWKIIAKFIAYETPKEISIPTILGTIEKELSPGKLEFFIDKKQYTLEPTAAGEGLFIVFADLTSGEETYGAGRFLYVDVPDSNNNVNLDFNKAYNPPCAFTKYATCPLPPDGNKIRLKITAGEKNYGNH